MDKPHKNRPPSGLAAAFRAIPDNLRGALERYWAAYTESAGSDGIRAVSEPSFQATLLRVWEASEFVAQACSRDPALLRDLLEAGDLHRAYLPAEYATRIARQLKPVQNDIQMSAILRNFRRREMVRIAWRDLAGWSNLEETLTELSALADACAGAALDQLHVWNCRQWGQPRGVDGSRQSLVVIGMGKLGAGELNFSSDIDLIFAFPQSGETSGRRPISNEEFFTRLCRRFVDVLSSVTGDGFVFRVDLRLRPYGDSGPVVMDFDAMEEYYQSQAREWERYAMIKARVIAGDLQAGDAFLQRLRPFVYRKYLDFGTLDALRNLKSLIEQEVRRRDLAQNIKLGPGGIREIEFIAQAFQLIHGGRDPALRERALLPVLQRLAEKEFLPEDVSEELAVAYCFLRKVENRLQMFEDRQTHEAPADETGRLRLARSMGYADWAEFSNQLEQHREQVSHHFQHLVAVPQLDSQGAGSDMEAVWAGTLEESHAAQALKAQGYPDAGAVLSLIHQLRDSHSCQALSAQGGARLDRLVPLVLGAVAKVNDPQETLHRVFRMLEEIARRSAYLSLLAENPMALSQLVRLADASAWVMRELTRFPMLLDELLDPRTLYAPRDRQILEAELKSGLQHLEADDLEEQMEVLRRFARSSVLRVAAADVTAAIPVNQVSDYLTRIAEVVLESVQGIASGYLETRHGAPYCHPSGRKRRRAGFAVIAYGKLGGLELGYGSDLDLVFLHDSEGEDQHTRGPAVLDNNTYFARLGQRMIHILNTPTPAGVLYEVDMRLRPSGRSGFLVSSLESFADYQASHAWTWEQQALVRARPVAGDPSVAQRFAEIREQSLVRERDPVALREEVREMRARMREELGSKRATGFDLKQDPGGIADIEFMVQYIVLRHAHEVPRLLAFTDNLRLLGTASDADILPGPDAHSLRDAYLAYRAAVHRLALQDQPVRIESGEFDALRRKVKSVWKRLIG